VNFIDDTYDSLHIKTNEKYKNIQVIKVGAEEGALVDYTYEKGEYTINETLLAQKSYILVCER
jgi:hypothetical protein